MSLTETWSSKLDRSQFLPPRVRRSISRGSPHGLHVTKRTRASLWICPRGGKLVPQEATFPRDRPLADSGILSAMLRQKTTSSHN